MDKIFISHSENDTLAFAEEFSKTLHSGDIVILNGGMGYGKSVFARGIVRAFGYGGTVTSPTFTLMNEYPTDTKLYHFDLYRLDREEQLYDIGFEDYIYSDGISLIEWAEKAGSLFPEKYIEVKIECISASERKISVNYENSEY